jgi:hypothetical protein
LTELFHFFCYVASNVNKILNDEMGRNATAIGYFPQKTLKNCEKTQNNQSLGRWLNLRPPEYEAGVLAIREQSSVAAPIDWFY